MFHIDKSKQRMLFMTLTALAISGCQNGFKSLNGNVISSSSVGGVSAPSPTPTPDPGMATGQTPQFPGIFDNYPIRPPWQVAGVDYGVGVTPGTVLKDPSTIKMSGIQVDASHHVISVVGDNITLDGYDFSLAGGWSVDDLAANLTISNSYFKIGSNKNYTIYGDQGSSNLSIVHTEIDGNWTSDRLNNGLIYTSSSGLNVQYCFLQNAISDFIQAQGGGQVTIMYNVLHNNGMGDTHPDWLQTLGSSSDPFVEKIMYNTAYQTVFAGSIGTQGFMMNDNGAVLTSGELAYNTIISLPVGAQGFGVSPITSVNGGSSVVSASVHDNFSDTRGGTYGNESFFSQPELDAKASYYNNINMATGGIYFQNAATVSSVVGKVQAVQPIVYDNSMPPGVSLTSASVSGKSIIANGTATVGGSWVATSSVEIFDNGALIGVVDSNSSGAWSFTSGSLASGAHSITARANNFFGYPSAVSAAKSVSIP